MLLTKSWTGWVLMHEAVMPRVMRRAWLDDGDDAVDLAQELAAYESKRIRVTIEVLEEGKHGAEQDA